jgi:uncharacterized protein with HEPN domain
MKASNQEYEDYLKDMLYAAEMAQSFVQGMDFDAFKKDEKTVWAVLKALEIIGEATKNIPAIMRNKYPDIPWREIAGMRDKMSHDYFGISLLRVFETVNEDLPALCTALARILKDIVEGRDE